MQPQPTSSSNPAETESRVRRRIIGFFMFPIALFPLLALCTYNWRDISDLCIPASASSNLVGIAGDWFAYIGYQFVGLGIWSVPAICVYMGLRLILGNTCHPGRRTIGVVLLVFSATCLLQVAGTSPTIAPLLRDLNIEPNAGGAVGYLVMTRCLVYHLAPFGASVLMICLAALSLFIIGAMIISTVESLPLMTCLFETASAIGTVGLTLGITPQLGLLSRLILISLMYFGRVGGLTLIYAAQSVKKAPGSMLPVEKVTVG